MLKKTFDGINLLYPTPTVIVGAMVDGRMDLGRVKPLLFDMSSVQYGSLGQTVTRCWNVGKKMKQK